MQVLIFGLDAAHLVDCLQLRTLLLELRVLVDQTDDLVLVLLDLVRIVVFQS